MQKVYGIQKEKQILKKLERVQKRATKLIPELSEKDHTVTDQRFLISLRLNIDDMGQPQPESEAGWKWLNVGYPGYARYGYTYALTFWKLSEVDLLSVGSMNSKNQWLSCQACRFENRVHITLTELN